MVILNSIIRFLSGKTDDDEEEETLIYYPLNGDNSSSFFQKSRQISLSFPKSIYNASKMLWQKLRIFFNLRRIAADDEPILPLHQNPAPRTNNDPLLVQTFLISSPSVDLCPHEEESQHLEDKYSDAIMQMDDVIISIPDFTNSLIAHACTTEEIIESVGLIEPQNHDPNCVSIFEHKEEEKKNCVSISEHKEEEKKKKRRKKKRKEDCNKESSVDEWRWIKHYSSRQRILIVGDGDFSFSASLAVAFGCASNMVATSLDSEAFLKNNYGKFMSNVEELRRRRCKVMHEIDATKMATHELLEGLIFDRIIYNFPFAGFFKDLPREAQLRRHRRLVSMFLKNAKEMISEDGEIHITHKTNEFHIDWKLESIASSHRLRLIEAVDFDNSDYPGYNTKCGFGGDNNFNFNPSKTYKFGLRMVLY